MDMKLFAVIWKDSFCIVVSLDMRRGKHCQLISSASKFMFAISVDFSTCSFMNVNGGRCGFSVLGLQ